MRFDKAFFPFGAALAGVAARLRRCERG